jgi:hypothetical protein
MASQFGQEGCDLVSAMVDCVDQVRDTRAWHVDISPFITCDARRENKRSFQVLNEIPWGFAISKIIELLQAYPSGLTIAILR